MIPNISVDQDKCRDALRCHKCLDICPNAVFGLGATEPWQKFQEIDPVYFYAAAARPQFCTGCIICIDACPQKAIEISFS